VTGGGTGIGLGIAEALADRGRRGHDHRARPRAAGGDAAARPRLHPLRMDVADEPPCATALPPPRARGPVTICVANAGIAEAAPFHRETLDHWRQIMATNLDGAFLTFQAALATLAPDQPARMIAISSIAGLRGLRNAIAYTASKHGSSA
jgi:3-hydroxybutyrate dehydrogenase